MQSELPAVKLENFEGPFDLLIELARSRKFDLGNVSLAKLTDTFLDYLQQKKLPVEVLADFIVVASTLVLLKAHQLLPELTREEEEEVEGLTERLRIYSLYRDRAVWFRQHWKAQPLLPGPERLVVYHYVHLPALAVVDLAQAMRTVVDRISLILPPTRALRRGGRSLESCLKFFQGRLQRFSRIVFQSAVGNFTKQDRAVSFLAVLELARRQCIILEQSQYLEDLTIVRHENYERTKPTY
jgi:segregation and condensation protein A